MPSALITGITGQDGSYLAELLVSKGYKVYGMVRRNSVAEHQESRIDSLVKSGAIHTEYGDILDNASIYRLLNLAQPDEIYNLAAQSHVRISFDIPQFTVNTNAMGVLNLLECVKSIGAKPRIYQASSSEMFGNSVDADNFQRETTPMHPVSPYGCAKLFAYSIMRNYRKAYKMFCANGILFNHESPRRGSNFVTNKIIKTAVLIKKGKCKVLEVGNMDSHRDWGFSRDYCKAMILILNHIEPDDFVISTGESHSVRELCEYVFKALDMDYHDYVKVNPKFVRPEELRYLRGDSIKARTVLGWRPEYTFEQMIDEMIEHWMGLL